MALQGGTVLHAAYTYIDTTQRQNNELRLYKFAVHFRITNQNIQYYFMFHMF